MRKTLLLAMLLVASMGAMLPGTVSAKDAHDTTVEKGHFEYFIDYPIRFVCDEVRRVAPDGSARETIHCANNIPGFVAKGTPASRFYPGSPARLDETCSGGWRSDFSVDPSPCAVDWHFTWTIGGRFDGWAVYPASPA